MLRRATAPGAAGEALGRGTALLSQQSLLAEPRTDARLTLELRMLRKEIVLLKQMVAHTGTAATARTSLN